MCKLIYINLYSYESIIYFENEFLLKVKNGSKILKTVKKKPDSLFGDLHACNVHQICVISLPKFDARTNPISPNTKKLVFFNSSQEFLTLPFLNINSWS